MTLTSLFLALTAALDIVNAFSVPTILRDPEAHKRALTNALTSNGYLTLVKRDKSPPPKWNFANSTTEDAKADGSEGIIIEPDLIEGAPGKDGGLVKKIKFGPYTVPAGAKREFPIGAFGLTPIEPGRPLPCTQCYITAMQLNMEYEDGKIANADTGAWLHHVDISVTGEDYTCPSTILGTIINFGDPSMWGARIYAGGNERVPVRLNTNKKYGIDPGTGTMGGAVEIMNQAVKPIKVYVTMLFEFVPKGTAGYKEARLVWVDVTNCAKESDFKPSNGVYNKQSKSFAMKHDGELIFANGHQHDGGVKVELLVNGKLSCTSKQLYANRRGHYIEPTDGTVQKDLVMPPNSHISDVGVCKDWGTVKKGDVLSVKAYFDGDAHMQMMNGWGVLEAQMGIMWTFVD
ncbi:hypothetical protein BT63DRAFT_414887 [Microthyrium microscopicum]|uniref:Uncharacterized protein n=1 Tax=Microthyrium microscopicum TaxID=703497 RepID=A0A6A6U4T1_9PEZI|nr:hypothetical protein BT63DRAFT_414887 [Microthyrium microscopicum]